MSKLRRNLASMLGSQVATFALTLVTVAVLPKRFGTTTYGNLAFATAYLGYFALALSLGSNQFLVKTIARDKSQFSRYISNALVMKLVLGTVLATAAVAGTHLLGYPTQIKLIVMAAGIGMVFNALSEVLSAALQATERMGKLALWFSTEQTVAGAIAILLVLANMGVVVFLLVGACGMAILVAVASFKLWPEIVGRRRVHDARCTTGELTDQPAAQTPDPPRRNAKRGLDWRVWKAIAAGGLPFASWSLILLIYGSTDILMLHQMTGSNSVAWYTLAYTWVGIPVFIPSVIVTVIFPSLSSKALDGTTDFSRTVNSALRLAVFIATPMAIGIALTASNIIGLFHYPAGFEHTVTLIQILAIHIPIVATDMILAIALAAKDRQVAWLVVGCMAAVFNPLMNLIAIPLTSHRFGDGAIGASIITVATELLMMVGAIYLRPAGILDRQTIWFLLRCVAASVTMIPVIVLANQTLLGVKILLGVLTFTVGAVVFRLVSVRTAREGAQQVLRSLRERERQSPVPTGVE